MTQIAVRLTDVELGLIDQWVVADRYASRADAVRAAIRALARHEEDRELALEYAHAFADGTTTAEERAWADYGGQLLADFFEAEGADGGAEAVAAGDESQPSASDPWSEIEQTMQRLLRLVQTARRPAGS